jgi:hypothetical protein
MRSAPISMAMIAADLWAEAQYAEKILAKVQA